MALRCAAQLLAQRRRNKWKHMQTGQFAALSVRPSGCYIERIIQSDELKPFKVGIAGVLGADDQPMTMPINWHSAV